ncbi:DUF2069 domain-containing protein [Lysobacter sp. D1-1-M9]|uniref:DUF2069 domain-containing protein n=1 Tax=Novilysobacter longmucuonensis TaxID=3098603 RepID=UPI002FC895FD
MMRRSDRWLAAALLALAALYAAWFRNDAHVLAALLVFALPPLLLALAVWRGVTSAGFWAGVFALGWFAHAVMIAWARPAALLPASLAIVLSVGIVVAGSLPGLRARFGGKRER